VLERYRVPEGKNIRRGGSLSKISEEEVTEK